MHSEHTSTVPATPKSELINYQIALLLFADSLSTTSPFASLRMAWAKPLCELPYCNELLLARMARFVRTLHLETQRQGALWSFVMPIAMLAGDPGLSPAGDERFGAIAKVFLRDHNASGIRREN